MAHRVNELYFGCHSDSGFTHQVRIKGPDNCELGKYLHTCRVKIIDDDKFPSNKYGEQIEEGHQVVPMFGLAVLGFERAETIGSCTCARQLVGG